MQVFYTQNINNSIILLENNEARHCNQVLRKKVGDQITCFDGKGNWYEGTIIFSNKKKVEIEISKSWEQSNHRNFKIHIAIAPTKNINRLEWFLEKSTEIGIDEITPILCARSERKTVRIDRLEKIILSATKQSLKANLPKLNNLTKFKDFITNVDSQKDIHKFIAHCEYETNPQLKDYLVKGKDVLILIGPEGDFHPDEVALALKHNFSPIGLGKERLRTETAGIVACHTVNLMQDA